MSRIGKKPIAIPKGVDVEVATAGRSASRAPRASS